MIGLSHPQKIIFRSGLSMHFSFWSNNIYSFKKTKKQKSKMVESFGKPLGMSHRYHLWGPRLPITQYQVLNISHSVCSIISNTKLLGSKVNQKTIPFLNVIHYYMITVSLQDSDTESSNTETQKLGSLGGFQIETIRKSQVQFNL